MPSVKPSNTAPGVMKKRAANAEQAAARNFIASGELVDVSIDSSTYGYAVTATLNKTGEPLLAEDGDRVLVVIQGDNLQREVADAATTAIRRRLNERRAALLAAKEEVERAEFERTPTEREAARLEEIEATVAYWERRNAEGIAHLADSARAVNFNGNDVEIAAQVAGRCEALRMFKPFVDGVLADRSVVEKLAIVKKRVDQHLAMNVTASRSTAGRNMVDACANEAFIEVWRILNDRNLY